jgi:tetratricopeptide (TPR) repeat protein
MKLYITLFIICSIVCSCHLETNGQKPDNTKPMFGEVPKTKEHIEIDQQFIEESLSQFGTVDSSIKSTLDNAWSYFYHNDLITAMKRFNQVWLLDPEYPDSYFGFAALLEMKNKNSEAERFYKLGKEKDLNGKRAEICFQRIADCKEQLNDIKGTIEAYKNIISINPQNSFAYKKIGFLDDNLEAYSKAIELDPNDEMTFNNRGYLFQKQKKYSNAIDDYTRAINLDPEYISAIVNRGITYMEMGEYKNAKKDFEKSVILDPSEAGLRRFLALSKLSLDDKQGACEDFQLAIQMGDIQSENLFNRNCK